jgi:hypothetical protein
VAITDTIQCDCDDTNDNRTLLSLRSELMGRLGYGAQAANPPPGMTDLLNSFLQEAQELLYRRYEVLRTERFFSWPLTAGVTLYDLPDNAEGDALPTPVPAAFATATTGGSLLAGTYYYRISAINARGETLASAETSQVVLGVATNTVTVNWSAVVAPDGVSAVTGYRIYGRTIGTERLIATVGLVTTYIDTGAITPAGALPSSNTTSVCSKKLDPRKVSWVGAIRDEIWYPLTCGIPPTLYSHEYQNWPQRYEIRQCIQIWPAPAETLGSLVIKGRFGLAAFTADTDKVTIDDRAVFLLALANAKSHYRQPDANNYVAQLEVFIDNLVAGAHQTRRYVPGRDDRCDYIYTRPVPTVPFT